MGGGVNLEWATYNSVLRHHFISTPYRVWLAYIENGSMPNRQQSVNRTTRAKMEPQKYIVKSAIQEIIIINLCNTRPRPLFPPLSFLVVLLLFSWSCLFLLGFHVSI